MKKIIKALSVCAVIGIMAAASVCLSGCDSIDTEIESSEVVSSGEGLTDVSSSLIYGWRLTVCYDNKTHVMYAVSVNGGITPLYNPDGSLRIYTEG